MIRKDYVFIAETIANSSLAKDQKTGLAESFATKLFADNHRFNFDKFLAACLREV